MKPAIELLTTVTRGAAGRRVLGALGVLVALLAPVAVRAQAQDELVRSLSKRMMCLCGCNQVLGECNHIGCTVSDEMMRKLRQRVARAEPADLILQSFVQEYGQKVLAEPPSSGFNRLAWVMPPLAVLLGLGLLMVMVRRWRAQSAQPLPARPRVSSELLARARRQAALETEDEPGPEEKR